MLVTLFGIVTLVSELHPLKTSFPILVMLSGIVMPVSELQPLNASELIVAKIAL